MNKAEYLRSINKRWFSERAYQLIYWEEFDYSILNRIMYQGRPGRGARKTYNDVIIMADTETSKKRCSRHNHVVAFTISMRAYGHNIVTLWGRRPDHFVTCLTLMMENMRGDETIVYFHNLSYDWVFIRKFLFDRLGYPDSQLATKSHYPVCIKFECGLTLKDSLILAQRSLEKWADDLNVEHKKAVGKWDYNKLRTQHEIFSPEELQYIEYDTLAGVECLDVLRQQLNKTIGTMPYTATGIPREDVRKLAKANRGRDMFKRYVPDYHVYRILERVYHGGYCHANRHEIGWINPAVCYDFASSYPFVLLSEKYPMEKFFEVGQRSINEILKNAADYAYIFRLKVQGLRIKGDTIDMPAFQYSKCTACVNPVLDNGRLLAADYAEIWITEQDLIIIAQQYIFSCSICDNVYAAYKDYLPRWLTDYIYKLFEDKTRLKGGDPVEYALAKAKINSVYGMMVQKSIRDELIEDYITGDYGIIAADPEELYQKFIDNHNSVLLYQWGVYVTAYAFKNLFDLGSCVSGIWLYSDTDSAYATEWDSEKLNAYNQRCMNKLQANGYGAVEHNGRDYWLGVAELDGTYSEFVAQGAKRYCGRSDEDGDLHITVAGVPKSGAACLNNDINNFKPGLIFDGVTTGKLTHAYLYVDEIYTDEGGNITGDSVDLTPCDYLLDSINIIKWEDLITEDVEVQIYDDNYNLL